MNMVDLETKTTDQSNIARHTDWANEPTISDLKQNYTDASTAHSAQVTKIDTWLDNLHVRGSAKQKKKKGRSAVTPKLIRKQAEWRYPALAEPFLSTEDIFNTAPKTHADRKASVQNGLVLNAQFNTQIQKVKFINEYVRTGVDEGTIIVRVGWDFEQEGQMQMQLVPTDDPTIIQVYEQLQLDPTRLPSVPPEIQQGFQSSIQMGQWVVLQEVEVQVTTKNQPTVEICNYNNVIIDPTCEGDLEKAQFVIFRFETSLSELEKEGKYFDLDKINIEGNSALAEPDADSNDEDGSFTFADKPRKKIYAYEYWGFWDIDKNNKTKPIVTTWVGDTIIRMEDNPFPDKKLPFVVIQHLPVRKSIYGEPDGELLSDNQEIVGATVRGMVDIMGRSANGQQGSRKDALDMTNRIKFENGDDYEYNAGVNPNEAFHMHKFPEIPNSAGIMLQLQQGDAESLTGVKAFHTGISGEALGNTATGVRSAMDATSKRDLDILRREAEGLKQIGRKITSMNSEFLSEEEIIRITDDEFVTVNRDDLAGNFDIELTISTAEADNEKAQELAFMLQTIGNNQDPGITRILQSEIARLRGMPDLAKRIEEFEPQPDPMAEMMKKLEIAKLQAEIAKIQSEARENNAEAMLDEAATRNKDSDTDLKNLNFVEQESGVIQERELEKQGAQARSNTKMKVIDNLMKERQQANKQNSA